MSQKMPQQFTHTNVATAGTVWHSSPSPAPAGALLGHLCCLPGSSRSHSAVYYGLDVEQPPEAHVLRACLISWL